MSTVYSQIFDLVADPASALRKQIAVAVFKAATDISNAADPLPGQLLWAKGVLENPSAPKSIADQSVWLVLQNPAIFTALTATPFAATDDDVQSVVNSFVKQLSLIRIAAGGN